MWEGVLHMTPAPSVEHQRILDELLEFLRPRLRESRRGALVSGINVFATDIDYRIPDLTFISSERGHVLHEDGVRGGGPDAVIEIRSPEDETYEKLPFYASVGIREVIVCHRDTKEPEIFHLTGSQYVILQRDTGGWLRSDVLGIAFRRVDATPPRLRVEDLQAQAHVEI